MSQLAAHVAARPLSSLDLGVKVPEEFQGLFSETEFMLWGPDDETRTRMATQALEATDKYPRVKPPVNPPAPQPATPEPAAPPRVTAPPPAPPERPREFVPPALIEHNIPLQDAEAQDAIGWVNWLQSQGAQPQGAQPQQAPPPPPQNQRVSNEPAEDTNFNLYAEPAPGEAPAGAQALRAMFAELGPTPHGGESETGRLERVKDLAQRSGAPQEDDVTRLEALEAELASSGFRQMAPGEGMLASLAAGEAAARALGVDPDATPPADGDYPARLRQARQWREEGRLDDAFASYRVLLKMAPDLLPDVMAEIEEARRAAPGHPEASRLLGDAKLKQGDYQGALEAYNHAVELAQPRR
jgi:hypothetical protein